MNSTFPNDNGMAGKKKRSMHDGEIFGSKIFCLFINCEKLSKVVKLYNSNPHRLLAPYFHQLVHTAFGYPIAKLQSWTYVSGHLRNMAKSACSRTCQKCLFSIC